MSTALAWVVGLPALILLGLFVGGMVSAWLECRRERRETGTVTRPGWQLLRERPCYCGDGYVCTFCEPGPRPLPRRRSL